MFVTPNTTRGGKEDPQTLEPYTVRLSRMHRSGVTFKTVTQRFLGGTIYYEVYTIVLSTTPLLRRGDTDDPLLRILNVH